jgi:hypothetical protein
VTPTPPIKAPSTLHNISTFNNATINTAFRASVPMSHDIHYTIKPRPSIGKYQYHTITPPPKISTLFFTIIPQLITSHNINNKAINNNTTIKTIL